MPIPITRWSMSGMPREVVMSMSGHASIGVHNGYVNVKDHHINEACEKFIGCIKENEVDVANSISY